VPGHHRGLSPWSGPPALGWDLAFRAGLGVLLTALMILPLLARIRAAEQLLRSQCGEEYGTYCARTARLIPGLYERGESMRSPHPGVFAQPPLIEAFPGHALWRRAMDLKLKDKVALITGSSRGIGLATAKAFAAEGCCLMLAARSAAPL